MGFGFHRFRTAGSFVSWIVSSALPAPIPLNGVWVPPVLGLLGVFGVFFLEKLNFREGAE